ncbi:putative bifunctional diguanylate cyclase/phosphodiesterase [Devosia beringensis]|uniref:putative bifunctional diguanylate cyclase/phosphodiesterase n=1 Tax=Devosia beringensis TaxID=2657486 RepID=UPI001AEDE1BE|nr:EAL domain-containing protein [Devosia beringensis]
MFRAAIKNLAWQDSAKQQALADAYLPIVRGFLLPASLYYAFVTWAHFQDETGRDLILLAGASAITAIAYWLIRQYALAKRPVSLGRLELLGVSANGLMYGNVVLYMLLHYTESKLIYFSLMAVVFSTTGVTLRGTVLSIVVSIGSLYLFANAAGTAIVGQYVFIGVATAFASLGMASLLRKAMVQQVDARLLADDLAAKAQNLARTDPLTGLPNRRAVFQELDALVAARCPFWAGIIDLDGFKSVNDVYGHVIGDRLLCAVVEQARSIDLGEGLFGRIGGDEFIFVLPGSLPDDALLALGERIIAAMGVRHQIGLLQLTVGASAGFAHFPSMGVSSAQIYEHADFALYRAKTTQRGRTVLFDASENQAMQDTLAIERALREGDLERELDLQFQPQYSISSGAIVSFEALARWNSPTLGSVRPDLFIGVAERCGLIGRVTPILFRKCLDGLAQLPDEIGVSFNLSAKDIGSPEVIAALLDMVASSGLAHERIEFEITETAVMTDLAVAGQLLADLSAAGYRIALDDFGSGYSSFQYIDQLPLDKVKLDKSFVRRVPHNVKSREIIASIIALCCRLGLRCVLEGVETEDEMVALTPLGPDLIQGYLFGRPMPLAQAIAAVADERAARLRAEALTARAAGPKKQRKAAAS